MGNRTAMQRKTQVKKTLSLLAACALLAGCHPGNVNDTPVHITGIQSSCKGVSGSQVGKVNGYMDLAGGTAYAAIFNWVSSLKDTSLTVGGATVTDSTANTFFAQQAKITYKASVASVAIPASTFDLFGSIGPTGSGDASF